LVNITKKVGGQGSRGAVLGSRKYKNAQWVEAPEFKHERRKKKLVRDCNKSENQNVRHSPGVKLQERVAAPP
jgi:hypothetical protein